MAWSVGNVGIVNWEQSLFNNAFPRTSAVGLLFVREQWANLVKIHSFLELYLRHIQLMRYKWVYNYRLQLVTITQDVNKWWVWNKLGDLQNKFTITIYLKVGKLHNINRDGQSGSWYKIVKIWNIIFLSFHLAKMDKSTILRLNKSVMNMQLNIYDGLHLVNVTITFSIDTYIKMLNNLFDFHR